MLIIIYLLSFFIIYTFVHVFLNINNILYNKIYYMLIF